MSNIILSDNRSSALLARRSVLIGLAASCLPAPAIVRAGNIMPVRPVLFTDPTPIYMGFVDRLMFDSLAIDLLRGYVSTTINNGHLSEAESSVRYALKNGWLNPTRADQVRLLLQDGDKARSVEAQNVRSMRLRVIRESVAPVSARSISRLTGGDA